MNKKVIYTSIVGDYDSLLQPLVVDESFDYICFTNDTHEKQIGVWKINPIPFACDNAIRQSRYVKIQPHLVLSQYDYSFWMDANLQIINNKIYEIINNHIKKGTLIAQVPHIFPHIDCTYDEIRYCYEKRKVDFISAYRQKRKLLREGFPKHFGLFENNVLLRKHSDSLVIDISTMWWKEYMQYTSRDQFSLMLIYWRKHFMPDFLLDDKTSTRNADCINYIQHRNQYLVNYTFNRLKINELH